MVSVTLIFLASVGCGGDDPVPIILNTDSPVDAGFQDTDVDQDEPDAQLPPEPAEIAVTSGPITLGEGDEIWLDAWVIGDNGEVLDELTPTWQPAEGTTPEGFTISADGHVVAVGPAPGGGSVEAVYDDLTSAPVAIEVVDPTVCPEVCTGGQICDVDTQQCVCPELTHLCDDVCVDSTSVEHCGTQCSPCQADNGFTPICEDLQCQAICEAPKMACDNICTSCPDVEQAVDFGCDGQQCVVTACEAGFEVCDQGCCDEFGAELVEGGGSRVRGRIDIAMDSDKNPHLVFFDRIDSMLKYAHHDGADWTVETLDFIYEPTGTTPEGSSDEEGRIHPSIAVDSQDNPHVAYRNADEGLKYAYHDGTAWTLELIDSTTNNWGNVVAGQGSAIVLDDDDHPHITAFSYGSADADIRLMSFDGTEWTAHDIGEGFAVATALAIDDDDRFHVLYRRNAEGSNHELVYAHRHLEDDQEWEEEKTFEINWNRRPFDMAVDSNGTAAIAFSANLDTSEIEVHENSQGSWNSTIIDGSNVTTNWAEINAAFDDQGEILVSYRGNDPDSDMRGLILARQVSGQWQRQFVAELDTGPPTPYHGLTVDEDNRLHLAYRDSAFSSVVWTHLDDSQQWQSDVAYSPEPLVGTRSSLVRLGDGTVHALYWDASNERIRHARRIAEDSWQIDTVSITAEALASMSRLQQGSDDSLHFVYREDGSPRRMFYMWYDGSQWHEELIEDRVQALGPKAFVLDANDEPHVLYQWSLSLSSPTELRWAHLDGGDWVIEELEASIHLANQAILQVDSQGHRHFASALGADLYYVFHDGAEWTEEVVDNPGPTIEELTFLLADDTPIITYARTFSINFSATGAIYVAQRDGADWEIEVLDDVFAPDRRNMVIGDDGTLYLTYYDEHTGHLMLTTWDGAQWQSEQLIVDAIAGGLVIDEDGQLHIGFYTPETRGYYYLTY